MNQLNWSQDGSIFKEKCLDYKATIIQNDLTSEFDAALLTEADEPIISWDGFADFEKAEEWVVFAVVDTEQNTNTLGKQRMEETFSLCRLRLDATADVLHIQRLGYIERWYFYRETQREELFEEAMKRLSMNKIERQSQQIPFNLTWEDRGNGLFAAPTTHGTAYIQEIRKLKSSFVVTGNIKHTVYIEHTNGARMEMDREMTDFTEAEAWIHDHLRQLDEPRIAKEYLENILFTLAVCGNLFRDYQEVFHKARIRYIRGIAETVLP